MASEPDKGFEQVFEQLTIAVKGELRPLLVYLDRVLNYLLAREEEGIRCTQVHLPLLKEEYKQALLEFIAVKTFYQSLEKDSQQDEYIGERLRQLQRMLERNEAPADARAAKGGNAVYRQWQEEKQRWGQEAAFLRGIAGVRKSLWPDTLLNIPGTGWPVLEESWYAVTLKDLDEGKKRSYCLLNDSLHLTALLRKLNDLGRLAAVRQVILFDCEWKRVLGSYKKDNLSLCADKMPVKDLVILSFERRPFRLSGLVNRMQGVYRSYFGMTQQRMQLRNSYIVQEEEVEQLLMGTDAALTVEWVGQESELFADYLDLVSGYGVEELRWLSTLNIYAGAINNEIAGLLMKDLFGIGGRDAIFPEVARHAVKKLARQERERLEAAVAGILEIVVGGWENIRAMMQKQVRKRSVGIVIAPGLKEFPVFRRELRQMFPNIKVNYYTWRDIRDENCEEEQVFILAYRDSGRYPFAIFPSLFQRGGDRVSTYQPVLQRPLFERRYLRSCYHYNMSLNELLRNEYRYNHLGWKQVDERVKAMKPLFLEDIVVEEDEEDELSEGADTVRVDFSDGSHGSYLSSRLLLVRSGGQGRLEVIRVDELPADVEGWLAQPLDELFEDMNPFQIRPEEEDELAMIRRKYGVTDKDQVLWKVLLVRKLNEGQSSDQLYKGLAELFGKKGFIQYSYFKDHWLDVHSKLLTPRKRRHFQLLCRHLGLEPAYVRLKLKKRASLRANSRESRSRMNSLLFQMIEEGLFEQGVNWGGRSLNHLLEAHGLEEVGITEENLNAELEVLVELLREKIHLKKLQKVER